MKTLICALIIVGVFTSCNSNNSKQTISKPSVNSKRDSITAAINKTPHSFTGLYKFSKEANTFQDCDDPSKLYWVNDSSARIEKRYNTVTQSLSYPDETVYAEVKGYLSGKASTGFASDYENVLVITSVDKLEPKSYQTACYNFEFIALGNEPFWSLDIIPTEQKIILKHVGKDRVFVFPYQPANIGGGVYRFETRNAANEKLVIILREEKCSDGMSERSYNFSAEVVINGETLKVVPLKREVC